MSVLNQENSQYPKIFLVCPNSSLLPPDDCLPALFHSGLDTNWIDRRLGLNEEGFLRDLFLRTNIAFELFPKSIFLFNVNVNKLDQPSWLHFLRLIKRLSSREDKPIHLGLMHDTTLLGEEQYRSVCTDDLLIRLGTNSRDNIGQLMQVLQARISERRKFPRFLCRDGGVSVNVTCRIEAVIYCAEVYDLSTGHFSCVFSGRSPASHDYGKLGKLMLSIGQQDYELEADFQLTRDIMDAGWSAPRKLFVFSFSSSKKADPLMIKRINHLVFTWTQRYTQDLIEEKRNEHIALQQDLAELRKL